MGADNSKQQQEFGLNDLGPLAWVQDEVRASLEYASKALKRFVRDATQARGSDLAGLDSSQLRLAKHQLHQVVGALEMVDLEQVAVLLRAMELAVQRFIQSPEFCNDHAATALEGASFALNGYLESLLAGRKVSAVALFAQYAQVQEIAGATRIHPADLWEEPWQWRRIELPVTEKSDWTLELRDSLDKPMLSIMRSFDAVSAQLVQHNLHSIACGMSDAHGASLWALAAAFFEGIATHVLPQDAYVKRTASAILLQANKSVHEAYTNNHRLAQDLLFFSEQAKSVDPVTQPLLHAVRTAYGLSGATRVDYSKRLFGQYDPNQLVQARKRIAAVKETWSLVTSGESTKFQLVRDQFQAIADSLGKIVPQDGGLSKALMDCASSMAQTQRPPSSAVAVEVATSLLYVEALFGDLDLNNPQLQERTTRLAQRIINAQKGQTAQPLEPWMEELYRKISDKQNMGSVVGELKRALGELEKLMDQFFRNPQETAALQMVPDKLMQMRGVLSVLGLDHATRAVLWMRDSVEGILAHDVNTSDASTQALFAKLGNNLGALGFLIDMLSYQPALTKELFIFDSENSELRPLMGRVNSAEARVSQGQVLAPVEGATEAKKTQVAAPTKDKADLDAAAMAAVPIPTLTLNEVESVSVQSADAALSLKGQDTATVEQISGHLASAPERHKPEDLDQELLDIFLEEAREVISQGMGSITALHLEPSKQQELTSLKRSFHTLKGSSRMVGLDSFGAAAWSIEQLLNAWLADAKPASPDLLRLTEQALVEFAGWIGFLSIEKNDGYYTAAPFERSAKSLLQGHTLVPLVCQENAQEQEPLEPESSGLTLSEQNTQTLDLVKFDLPDLELSASSPAQDDRPTEIEESEASSGVVTEFNRFFAPTDVGSLTDNDKAEMEASAPARHGFEPTKIVGLAAPDHVSGEGQGEPDTNTDEWATRVAGPDEFFPKPAAAVSAVAPEDGSYAATTMLTLDDSLGSPTVAVDGLAKESLVDVSNTASHVEQSVPEPDLPLTDDEQYKIIGDVRISAPLYNVFLGEADEWSRRLVTEISEWAMESERPLPEAAVALAHSLAGSSGTVGYSTLSSFSRSFEHVLERDLEASRARDSAASLATGPNLNAQVYVDCAQEIRHLLHQFAAGIWAQARDELVQALHAVNIEPVDTNRLTTGATVLTEDARTLNALELDRLDEAKGLDSQSAQITGSPHSRFVDSSFVSRLPTAPSVPRVAEHVDDLDAVDAIDENLFPIFEDEAAELLPALSSSLRQWYKNPADLQARSGVLRALHTIKGSARLAGAMRMGEMAHRMESAIEELGEENVSAQEIEALLARFDDLNNNFDGLRTGVQEAHVEPAVNAVQTVDSVIASESVPEFDARVPATDLPVPPAPQVVPARVLHSTRALDTSNQTVRVRSNLLDRLVNQAGEVMISRVRLENEIRGQLRTAVTDLNGNLERLRKHLRDLEVQTETQMQSRLAVSKGTTQGFDPLEFDRFTRVQEITRMMAESVDDMATVQRHVQRVVDNSEGELIAQARQTRDLQSDLLRTRMVEFDSIAERLYRVVRQAAKESNKQIRLNIQGGTIEVDRGVLERMTGAFEHLLRNCVAHGIEPPTERQAANKDVAGIITITVEQEGNDVAIIFSDDGAGLNTERILARAKAEGVIAPDAQPSEQDIHQLIFHAGISTAKEVTAISGRGVGMDVVHTEAHALGGRVEVSSTRGQGSSFKLILPLTTAVTQVVMVRTGALSFGIPANLLELVRRVSRTDLAQAYSQGVFEYHGEMLPFFWGGALLDVSGASTETADRTVPVVIVRSAAQRVAMHLDEVLGNQEVVVKNLGPQLARLPGLAGMSLLASGAVVLIYNPVALATVYGIHAKQLMTLSARTAQQAGAGQVAGVNEETKELLTPLVMVVDDSITVRRVTQRLLQREGYRVLLANDGLHALEKLAGEELPVVILSDIEMPRMDGFDLVRNLHGQERLKNIPVIMITSRIADKHREYAASLGVHHYLGKPYSEEELLGLIHRYAGVQEVQGLAATTTAD